MIPSGSSTLTAMVGGVALDVFTYRPSTEIGGLLFIFHGTNRNADDYCRFAQYLADRRGLIVIAPRFDTDRFPNIAYHRGNIVDSSGRVRPPSEWTTRFVPLLVDWARQREGAMLPYWLWGFSAGGQFLSRVAAFEQPDARRIVVGGASTHVLPLLGSHPNGERAPYGMGGVFGSLVEAEKLRGYLALPLSIYVGGDDNNADDPLLTSGSAADRQGTDRLDRGQKTLALARFVAESNGWRFGWRMVIGPEIAHSSSRMLRSRRVLASLGLYDTSPVYRIPAPPGKVDVRLRMRGFERRPGVASDVVTATAA
jgi:hypothetical protein